MTDKIVDLKAHQDAKKREIEALRSQDGLLDCDNILADAIERMWDFADRAEILKTLRHAIEILEEGNEN